MPPVQRKVEKNHLNALTVFIIPKSNRIFATTQKVLFKTRLQSEISYRIIPLLDTYLPVEIGALNR